LVEITKKLIYEKYLAGFGTMQIADYLSKKKIPIPADRQPLIDELLNSLEGFEEKKEIPEKPTEIWTAVGCDTCNYTGYKGRIGVYEAILADRSIELIIRENPSEREIREAAAHQKILCMKQDGIIKIIKGVTSFEELERVVDLAEEIIIVKKEDVVLPPSTEELDSINADIQKLEEEKTS
jgi:hypothetical protein